MTAVDTVVPCLTSLLYLNKNGNSRPQQKTGCEQRTADNKVRSSAHVTGYRSRGIFLKLQENNFKT